ncbi:MAG: 1-acyl-sn-glycerol-3-phosphate acyltransferase, partial [Clostridia bacterium]|nr:1-acyl-sn-glycerol-3-phosphate acyltransferase [Clostridia bacterium]
MKIKMKRMTYDEVMALPRPRHRRPLRPDMVFRTIIRVGSIPALIKSKFSYTAHRMDLAGKGPWLVLMNHSCFMDLKMASKILYPKPFCTVCTSDGFVGKNWLMRVIGCIPTQKFVSDLSLIRDILYAVREKKTSVLMYPEAGYSFDGRATPLPRKLGVLLKKLDVPVVTITSKGAFARDPLYNGLQLRKVKVSAHVQCLLTPEEIREKSV